MVIDIENSKRKRRKFVKIFFYELIELTTIINKPPYFRRKYTHIDIFVSLTQTIEIKKSVLELQLKMKKIIKKTIEKSNIRI